MNLKEYQDKARSTAIYDKETHSLTYPTLGLIGETGETAEKIKKAIRDDGGKFTDQRKQDVIKELGDCCWYIANLCCDFGVDLSTCVAKKNPAKMIFLPQLELARICFRMSVAASQIAFHVEQLKYDETFVNVEQTKHASFLFHNISSLMYFIEEIAKRMDSNLEEVLRSNIVKLMNRKQSGTLQGDGDNR